MEYQTINGKKHFVYDSVDEFVDHQTSLHGSAPTIVEDWREGREGDWVMSDDNRIVQILRWGELPHPNDRKNWKAHRGYCRTIVGSFMQNEKTFMDTDFSQHPNRYRFSKKTDGEIWRHRRERETLSKAERHFVSLLIAGKSLQSAFEEAFEPSNDWYRKAIFLLRRERVMNHMKDSVNEAADDLGIDVKFILQGFKELASSMDEKAKLGALKELAEIFGLKDKTKQIAQGEIKVFDGFSGEEAARLNVKETKELQSGD